MSEYTFKVAYTVVQYAFVTVRADAYPQAEARMLRHMLDSGKNIVADPAWKLINEKSE